MLETFHPNIKFTYEKEVNNTLPFLDVLFIRNSDHIHTTVYKKETNNVYAYIGMHLHLYLGNMEHSELWLMEPVLSVPTIIIYSKN